MLSKKNSMVTMVTDEFLENRIILQKSVVTIGFIWFFWFQKCILFYIFAQVFLVMRSIRSHISVFRLGFTPTLRYCKKWYRVINLNLKETISLFLRPPSCRYNRSAFTCVGFNTLDYAQVTVYHVVLQPHINAVIIATTLSSAILWIFERHMDDLYSVLSKVTLLDKSITKN